MRIVDSHYGAPFGFSLGFYKALWKGASCVAFVIPSLAAAQASGKTYVRRIETIADSGYFATSGFPSVLKVSVLPSITPNDTVVAAYALDSAATLASHWSSTVRRYSDDFDSREPAPSFARIHAQLVTALNSLSTASDSLATALRYRAMRDRIEYTTRVIQGMSMMLEAQRLYEAARKRAFDLAKSSKLTLRDLTPIGLK